MPNKPPTMALVAATKAINGFNWFKLINGKIKSAKGANFCQVQRIRQLSQLIDDIVDGNQ
jgi:hypothetical protein